MLITFVGLQFVKVRHPLYWHDIAPLLASYC